MPSTRLAKALETALTQGVEVVPMGNPLMPLLGLDPVPSLDGPPDAVKGFLEALAAEPALGIFRSGQLQTASMRVTIEFRDVAGWLILGRQEGRQAAELIYDLLSFAESNTLTAYNVITLAGIRPDKLLAINEGIDLLPFADLPASRSKELINSNMHMIGKPRIETPAALRLKYKIYPAIVSPEYIDSESLLQHDDALHEMAHEIIEVLTLIGPSAPVPVGTFSYVADAPLLLGAASASGLGQLELPPNESAPIGPFIPEKATHAVRAYLALPQPVKTRLKIPLDRLNKAVRRRSDVDRALELGIALEALLLQDQGSGDPVSLPLRLRGAWLIGRNSEERKKIYDQISKLYGYRCQAAHNGSIKAEKTGVLVEDKLREGLSLCSELILRMVEIKGKVDWTNLILGNNMD